MDLFILPFPDPAVLSISGPISDLNIRSVHPYQGVPCLHPETAGIGSSNKHSDALKKG